MYVVRPVVRREKTGRGRLCCRWGRFLHHSAFDRGLSWKVAYLPTYSALEIVPLRCGAVGQLHPPTPSIRLRNDSKEKMDAGYTLGILDHPLPTIRSSFLNDFRPATFHGCWWMGGSNTFKVDWV